MEFIKKCVLCNAGNEFFKPYCTKSGYSIVLCSNCGLIFVNPRDNENTISNQYQDNLTSPISYYQVTAKTDAINFNKRLDWIESKMSRGKVLDIGCNVGTFLELSKNRGWEVMGIEPNKKACEICNSKGLNVRCGLFGHEMAKSLEGNRFDLITLNDTIEHFTHPVEMVRMIAACIRQNGFLAISTPNVDNILARIFQIKPKEHLFYFNKSTLSRFLEGAGFKIELLVETGRRRDIASMPLGATFENKYWIYVCKFLGVTGLSHLVSLFLEKIFADELFVLAKKKSEA